MKFFGYAILFSSIAAASTFAAQASSIPSFAAVPSNAQSSGDLSASSKWFWSHDSATPGSAVASSEYPVSNPSLDGKAREYSMSYSNKGGERFSLTFGHNTEATHFVYDTYVYINEPSQLANLEMDMNQVISDGKTVIYAFQCSGNSGAWEYSTISGNSPHWHSTGLACSPKKWSANTWHHIQIASHRNSSGDVTYDWVNFDGDYKQVNKSGNGAVDLHWSIGDLNLNFQLDGAESRGSVKIYSDKLTILYW
jgi:hypothetical protein